MLFKKQKIPFIIRSKQNTLAGGIQTGVQVPVIELCKKGSKKKPLLKSSSAHLGAFSLPLHLTSNKIVKKSIIVVSNIEFSDAIALYLRR